MISSIATPVRWYNTIAEQNRNESDFDLCEFELISDKTRMLPFQFKRPSSGYSISKWFLRKSCTDPFNELIDTNSSLFTLDTGYWTKVSCSFINGKLKCVGTTATLERLNVLTPGKRYEFKVVVSEVSNLAINASVNSSNLFTLNAPGTYTINYLATGTDTDFQLAYSSGGALGYIVIDSIQIREKIEFSTLIGDIELSTDLLSLIATTDYDYITYCGNIFDIQIPCGNYYMIIETTDYVQYYSEVITVKDFIPSQSPYVLLEWKNSCDLSDVIYQTISGRDYINRLYLNSPISKPEYPFKEEGEEDGNSDFNVTFQKWEKKEMLTVAKAPDFIVDALTALKLHDTITVTKPLRKKQITVLPSYEVKSVEFEVYPVINDFANNIEIKMLLNDKIIDSTCCSNITIDECVTCNRSVGALNVIETGMYFGSIEGEDFGLYNVTTASDQTISGYGSGSPLTGFQYYVSGDVTGTFAIGNRIYVAGTSKTENNGIFIISALAYDSGSNTTAFKWAGIQTQTYPEAVSGKISKVTAFESIGVQDDLVCVEGALPYLFLNGDFWVQLPSFNNATTIESLGSYGLRGFGFKNSYLKLAVTIWDGTTETIKLYDEIFPVGSDNTFNITVLKSSLPVAVPSSGYVKFMVNNFTMNCDYDSSEYFQFNY